jgi:bis(5'-nucleosyl)-tetraphosphatase (symmetrical)
LAVYAIGDLQGCYDSFRRLLDKLEFEPPQDRLWLTGDLVNRGPKSLKTLRFVKSLGDSVSVVLGNHDLHLLALASQIRFSNNHFDSLWKVMTAPDSAELLDWLRRRPLAHFDAELNTLMVHAGVPPQWTVQKTLALAAEVEQRLRGDDYTAFLEKMYGNKPSKWADELEGNKRLRVIVNCLTRMRMIRTNGRLDFTHAGPPESADKSLKPWFDAPEAAWRGTRIVFGHWSALGLLLRQDVVGIDTGCVWGRNLTAVKLTRKAKVTKVRCRD